MVELLLQSKKPRKVSEYPENIREKILGKMAFISARTTEEQDKQIKASDSPVIIEDDMVEYLLKAGHKMSVTYDVKNECFIASIIGREDCENWFNRNWCLSERGSTAQKAIKRVLWVFFEICECDISTLDVPRPKNRLND